MAEDDELLAAVRDQAEARLRMDLQGYSKYLTQEAMATLRASFPGMPPRVHRYEIEKRTAEGEEHVFEVRYFGDNDSFLVRSRWQRLESGWMAVHAERLWREDEARPGLLSRLGGSLLRSLAGLRGRLPR